LPPTRSHDHWILLLSNQPSVDKTLQVSSLLEN
jgi:hypothetical protein